MANADESCRFMGSRSGLAGYEVGGPYNLDHFKLTKGRTDLREFLWRHWHNHIKGIAEASFGTVDAGTLKALYVIQPDAKGKWGIDVELRRTREPSRCSAVHADSLVRIYITKPDEDYPAQTFGPYWSDCKVPTNVRMPDSEAKGAKYYKIILTAKEKALAPDI